MIQLAAMAILGVIACVMLYLGNGEVSIVLGIFAALVAPSPISEKILEIFGAKK